MSYTFDGINHVRFDPEEEIYVSAEKHSPAIHKLAIFIHVEYGEYLTWEDRDGGEYVAYVCKSDGCITGNETEEIYDVMKNGKIRKGLVLDEAAEILLT